MKHCDKFERFISGGMDVKGRAVRYEVGLREELETGEYIAWVQKWISDGVKWRQFGKVQWKKLKTQDEGRAWAYEYVKKRAVGVQHENNNHITNN